jgi:hypothetical protein
MTWRSDHPGQEGGDQLDLAPGQRAGASAGSQIQPLAGLAAHGGAPNAWARFVPRSTLQTGARKAVA